MVYQRHDSLKPAISNDLILLYRNPPTKKLKNGRSYFTKIHDCVLCDPNISDRQLRVYGFVVCLARSQKANRVVTTIKEMARFLKRGISTVRETLVELEEKELLVRAKDTENPNKLVIFLNDLEAVYGDQVNIAIWSDKNTGEIIAKVPSKLPEKSDSSGEKETDARQKPGAPPARNLAVPQKSNRQKPGAPPARNLAVPLSDYETNDSSTDKELPVSEVGNDACYAPAHLIREEKRREKELLRNSFLPNSLRSFAGDENKNFPFEESEKTEECLRPDLVARDLPFRKSFIKDQDEDGNQRIMFDVEKKPKVSKKSSPEKSSRRYKKVGKERITPKGGTTPIEAFEMFNEELLKTYPNAAIPLQPTGKDFKNLAQTVSVYKPEVVRKMAQVLVADYSTIKDKVFPKPKEGHPVLSHMYRLADVLASRIDTGFTDGSSRVSSHVVKNVKPKTYKTFDEICREKYDLDKLIKPDFKE